MAKDWKPCMNHIVRSTWNKSIDALCPVCEIERLTAENSDLKRVGREQMSLVNSLAAENSRLQQIVDAATKLTEAPWDNERFAILQRLVGPNAASTRHEQLPEFRKLGKGKGIAKSARKLEPIDDDSD